MKYGLIGKTLKHSISPEIHRLFGTADYFLKELAADEVAPYVSHGDFLGLNVTIPYKKTVIPFCTGLSQRAQRCNSVNTLLRREDGALFGDNTDYDGFLYMAREAKISFLGQKVVILGSGGAGETVAAAVKDEGAGEIVILSRKANATPYSDTEKYLDADILVNCTPVGMYPKSDETPLKLSAFSRLKGVLDLIYNPLKTRLLDDAAALGLPHASGLMMLVEQARRSEELFLRKKIPQERNAAVYAEAEALIRSKK
ncbi:MAG TPA: shikimate dehydrogenase [Clostridiales bacterium]|nr:shikimate dehydrogenase [Clostridiales bacterium]